MNLSFKNKLPYISVIDGVCEGPSQIPLEEKVGVALGAPRNLGLPLFATAEASDFKFGTQLGFAKAHKKSHPEAKRAWPRPEGAPKILGSPIIFLQRLELATSNVAAGVCQGPS